VLVELVTPGWWPTMGFQKEQQVSKLVSIILTFKPLQLKSCGQINLNHKNLNNN
jgi:hypothetical protein